MLHKIWDLGFPENWIEPHSVQSSGAFAWELVAKLPQNPFPVLFP